MLQFHFYSNYAGRLVLDNERLRNWFASDIYPPESIKEFEQISDGWKQCLAELLKKGCVL